MSSSASGPATPAPATPGFKASESEEGAGEEKDGGGGKPDGGGGMETGKEAGRFSYPDILAVNLQEVVQLNASGVVKDFGT